jgi:arylsulfatase A
MNKISKAFGLFFLLGVLGQVVSSTPSLPNVLIIYVDDMGYGDLGVQNPDSLIPTPHLDQLAGEGMRFTDGHSSSSQCSPSRYALLTGRYHWRHSDTLTSDMGPSAFTKEQLTLPEMFQELGYETAAIGKWHLGFNWLANVKPGVKLKNRKDPDVNAFDWTLKAPDGPTSHGFDYYFGDGTTNKPPFAWVENDHIAGDVPNVNLTREMSAANDIGPGVKGWDHEKVMPTLTQKAVEWIAKREGDTQPFFMYFSTSSPHAPVVPIEPFVGSTKVGPYGDYVAQTDWSAGQVLGALKTYGFEDNTVVIFSSDNGPAGSMEKRYLDTGHNSSGPLRGRKLDTWEGGHRVPFVIRWPGVTSPGSVSDALISQIDLMATFGAAFDYQLPKGQAEDSINMMPVLRDQAENPRDVLVHNNKLWGIRKGDWVLLENPKVSKRADYLKANRFPKIEEGSDVLYNLSEDIGQRVDLLKKYPEKAEQLREILHQARSKRN